MESGKKEITVTFKTITPLWTGDAWGECKEIRPSSLIGSLRFWFAFYWEIIKNGKTEKLIDGIPQESLTELKDKGKVKNFQDILKRKLTETNSLDEAIDKTLDELDLSVPSRIFGCTGWKSRVKILIESYSVTEIDFNGIEFRFPLDRLSLNSRFWIKKTLFNKDIKKLKLFKNIKVKLVTTNYWWNKYLRDFFEFSKDKLILVGGKNSFGFGFVNLSIKDSTTIDKYSSIKNNVIVKKIENIPYSGRKKVLGFNFKYYLRKLENKKHREKIFGKQKVASKIYISNLLEEKNNSIYLLLLNNPFSRDGKILNDVYYRKILESLTGDKDEYKKKA
ncbi:type III-B CRISPR module RAMP protein Cmr1 [Desulfurobacterium sp. TC5-1]|uniref:type III-B CRISPR module RAMP protein Cmr1 n=1 Tax=Desulfurobacterium sp. TC5-1 TaxID=1158318 RepID=UPI0003B62F1D|nr:type III-B CRISPR module RAMP protein Cmr1 [Desulfurobacterium sp. TC5-1]